MRVKECDIPGCHFSGTCEDLEEHMRLQSPQHLKLLQSNAAQLTDSLVHKVTHCQVYFFKYIFLVLF